MSFECPNCHGVLYDRKRNTCGFCGATLPPELLFTPAQVEVLRHDANSAEQRRQEKEADEKLRRDREIGDSSQWMGDT
ncbi:MAG TPA: hypothetical protein VLT36_21285 [Candidatus Dormibacteraeota bacterium]|nr:hypothetical protein [Candidatus Dormibacteraeota bacterium]